MLSAKQVANTAIEGPTSARAVAEETLSRSAQDTQFPITKKDPPKSIAAPQSIKNVLDTYLLAASRSSLPLASDTAFSRPLPRPRSVKASIAIIELIAIHIPYLS